MSKRRSKLIVGVTAALLVATGVAAENFDLSWSTIDGGGVLFSSGGDWELSGTIGQPDAAVLRGDEYTLTGGFWFATPYGDCNHTGGVNLLDYDAFAACLSGPEVKQTAPDCSCFDIDRDQDVDLSDAAEFQASFTNG